MLSPTEMNQVLTLFSRVPTQGLDEAQMALDLRVKLHAHFNEVVAAAQAVKVSDQILPAAPAAPQEVVSDTAPPQDAAAPAGTPPPVRVRRQPVDPLAVAAAAATAQRKKLAGVPAPTA